jgi:hypothetical protein
VKAVASGDEIAINFLRPILMPEPDFWLLRFEIVHGDAVNLEQQWATVTKALVNQVLHNLLLAVDGYALVHHRLEIDAMQITIDADIDAPMQHPFLSHALTYSHVAEEIGGPMFNQAGPNAVFDIVAAAIFNDD